MNGDRGEIFRGHLDECVRHLGRSLASSVPKGSREAARAKKPIADFCGVVVDSVTRWLNDARSLPIGEPRIKLMCCLDTMGYRVIELERMSACHRNFAELIAYGLLSGDEASTLLGYSSASIVYQVLQGHRGASDEKNRQMWDLWKERKEVLTQKKEGSHELCHLNIRPSVRPVAAISIMEGLLALLEEAPISRLPDSALVDLNLSLDTVARLSSHFEALHSRLIKLEQQQKGGS